MRLKWKRDPDWIEVAGIAAIWLGLILLACLYFYSARN
jgi:hypothetical protein